MAKKSATSKSDDPRGGIDRVFALQTAKAQEIRLRRAARRDPAVAALLKERDALRARVEQSEKSSLN